MDHAEQSTHVVLLLLLLPYGADDIRWGQIRNVVPHKIHDFPHLHGGDGGVR